MINDIEYRRKVEMLKYKLEKNTINNDEERYDIVDILSDYHLLLSELDDIQSLIHNTKIGIDKIFRFLGSDKE